MSVNKVRFQSRIAMNNPVAPSHTPSRTSGLAVASLVLGIIGAGVPAIICGHMAQARIRRDPSLEGSGFALAGLILGYVTTALLVVIFVLGAVIGFSGGMTAAAREQAAQAKMSEIQAKLESYRIYAGSYPTTAQGLEALVTEPATDPVPRRWQALFNAVPVDPWGAEYVYEFDAATGLYTVGSKGPDGIAGTADDL